jgi:hypothetical protein
MKVVHEAVESVEVDLLYFDGDTITFVKYGKN